MGKKRTAVVGDLLSEEDLQKQERQKRQKEAAKAAKMAAKTHVEEATTTHVPGQKGGERVKDLSTEMLAEAEAVRQKEQEATQPAPETVKKPKVIRERGKIYKAARSKVETKDYPLPEALKLLRDISYAKMDATVELHLNLTEKNQSANVELPFSTGKTKKIAVANDQTLEKIEKNQIDFDILVASPSQMAKLVKFAKTLGPRGLMPNPKNGTIADNPEETAKKMAASATVSLKTDKDSVAVHTTLGKLSQKDEEILANIKAVLSAFSLKLKNATLKSTMSPGIKISLS